MLKQPMLVPLNKINVRNGDVFHGLKASEESFKGFGELYFTRVDYRKIKGWKRHRQVTLNLVVIEGGVKFVIGSSDLFDAEKPLYFQDFIIGPSLDYSRLVVPPGYWVAFQGIKKGANIIANIIEEEHDANEADFQNFGNLIPKSSESF